jgi:hypothetical protein
MAYRRPVLHLICRATLLLGIPLKWISGPWWFVLPVLFFALLGLESLMGTPVVVKKSRPKDFIADELGTGDPDELSAKSTSQRPTP